MIASDTDLRSQQGAAAQGASPADPLDAEPAGRALTEGPFHVGRLHILDRENAIQRAREKRQVEGEPRLRNGSLFAEEIPLLLSALQPGQVGFRAAFAEGLGLSGNREERIAELQTYLQAEQDLFYGFLRDAVHIHYAEKAGRNAAESASSAFSSLSCPPDVSLPPSSQDIAPPAVEAVRSPSFVRPPSLDPDAEPTVRRRDALDEALDRYFSHINAETLKPEAVPETKSPGGTSVWENEYARLLDDDGNPHWINIQAVDTGKPPVSPLFPGLLEKAGVFPERGKKKRHSRAKDKAGQGEEKQPAGKKRTSFVDRILRLIVIGGLLGFAYLTMVRKGCVP